jgi:hypothetical protein
VDAYKSNDLAAAERRFEEALRLDPRQARRKRFYGNLVAEYVPQFYLALIYARTNRPAEAQKLRDSLSAGGLITSAQATEITAALPPVAEGPRWARAYIEGEDAYRTGDLTTAEARFDEALRLDSAQSTTKRLEGNAVGPYLPEFYLAQIYARTNRRARAEALRDKLIAANLITSAQVAQLAVLLPPEPAPRWSDAYGEGVAAYQTGDLATAEARFKEALTLDGTQSRRKAFPDRAIREYVPELYLAQIYARTNRAPDAQVIQSRLTAEGLMTAEQAAALTALLPAAPAKEPQPPAAAAPARATAAEREALRALLSGNYQAALRLSTRGASAANPSPRLLYYAAWGNAALGMLSGGARGQRMILLAQQQFARARAADPNGFAAESRYISPRLLQTLRAPGVKAAK